MQAKKTETVPSEMGDPRRYPYLAVGLMPTLYQSERIYIGPRRPRRCKPSSIVVVHPDPRENGRLRPEVEQEVIDQAVALCVRVKTFRMCVMFSNEHQVYVKPSGYLHHESNQVPTATIAIPVDSYEAREFSREKLKAIRLQAVSLEPRTLPNGEDFYPARTQGGKAGKTSGRRKDERRPQ